MLIVSFDFLFYFLFPCPIFSLVNNFANSFVSCVNYSKVIMKEKIKEAEHYEH